jgi:transposase-like protein
MKSSSNKISREVKSQILLELTKPGCGVRNISRQYGVSRGAIYKWLKDQRASVAADRSDPAASDNDRNKFVELSVVDSAAHSSLTKASLVFQDFSLSLEGNLSSSKLISILKILEVTC